jgi:hypothetical protein
MLPLIRKDVDKFKLEGDPALLAAVRAEDNAKTARDQCDAIRLRMQEKDAEWAQQTALLSETLHLNRHDALERIRCVCIGKASKASRLSETLHLNRHDALERIRCVCISKASKASRLSAVVPESKYIEQQCMLTYADV